LYRTHEWLKLCIGPQFKNKEAFQKMHAKKVLSDSKEKNKLEIIDKWSILKEKNKIGFKFSIGIMKLNFLVFIEFSR
jgi:hypothetical protein